MRIICTLLITFIAFAANAEVIKSVDHGFILQLSATVAKDHKTVFIDMTTDVGKWWNPDHTFSADAGNMLIDQNCFCERWDGNLVVHLNTAVWMENSKVIFEGGLGPLKDLGLDGTMTWSVEQNQPEGTTITWKYYVHGFSDTNVIEFAPIVDGVLAEQLARLVRHVSE